MEPTYPVYSYWDPYFAYYYQYYNPNLMNNFSSDVPFQYSSKSMKNLSNEIYGIGKEEQKMQIKSPNQNISFNTIVNKKTRVNNKFRK